VTLRLFDSSGTERTLLAQGTNGVLRADLEPGRYVLGVGAWTPAQAALVVYQLGLSTPRWREAPPPLTVGASPAIRFRILGAGSSVAPTTAGLPPPLTTNTSSGTVPGALLVSPSRPLPAPGREFLGLGSVPTSVLYAMATGPMGGTAFGSSAGSSPRSEVLERVFAQAPEIFLRDQLLRLTILAQPPSSGTEESSPPLDRREPESAQVNEAGSLTPDQSAGGAEKAPWEQALDMLQNLWNQPQQRPGQAASLDEDSSCEEGSSWEATEEQAATVPTGLPGEMERTVLVVAAALAHPRRRQPDPSRLVPRDSRTEGKQNEPGGQPP
jgi:hypothetical protein